jgi:hypothetical protein
MNPPKRDRRPKCRIIENALHEFQPLIDAGYPLKDIWETYQHNQGISISYRHFIRTIARLRKATVATTPEDAPDSWLGRLLTKWKN